MKTEIMPKAIRAACKEAGYEAVLLRKAESRDFVCVPEKGQDKAEFAQMLRNVADMLWVESKVAG